MGKPNEIAFGHGRGWVEARIKELTDGLAAVPDGNKVFTAFVQSSISIGAVANDIPWGNPQISTLGVTYDVTDTILTLPTVAAGSILRFDWQIKAENATNLMEMVTQFQINGVTELVSSNLVTAGASGMVSGGLTAFWIHEHAANDSYRWRVRRDGPGAANIDRDQSTLAITKLS